MNDLIEFILANISTVIVGALVLLAVILAVISLIKDRKRGKCPGGCAGCDGKCCNYDK